MAKTTRAAKPARQLGELLQEQQEPFILEVYLSERGCLRKNLSSRANFTRCRGNSGRLLKKLGSQNQSKRGIPSFPKVLKVVLCNKFFTIKGLRTKNSHNEDGKLSVTEMDRNIPETAEPDRFSTVSSTTVYISCSDSDMDEPPIFAGNLKFFNEWEKKAAADAKHRWSCMEDSKQHRPPSVLEEISSSTSYPLANTRRVSSTRQKSFFLPKLITEDSILSASLWNLLIQTTPEKSSCAGLRELRAPDRQRSNSSAFSVSKWVLQQTKQLLFDCVRELAKNNHEKEDKEKVFVGSEQIGNVMCKKMKERENRCGDESNVRELLESDVMDFGTEKSEIGLVIGNAIVDEITCEVVMDMMIINVL